MVDENVLRTDRREAVAAMFADAFGKTRRVSGEFEVGAIDVDERRQRREADETADLGNDRIMPLNIGTQHLGDLGRHIGFEFHQDNAAAAAAAERGAEQAHTTLGLFRNPDKDDTDEAKEEGKSEREDGEKK